MSTIYEICNIYTTYEEFVKISHGIFGKGRDEEFVILNTESQSEEPLLRCCLW
jgi:hypothetical protein